MEEIYMIDKNFFSLESENQVNGFNASSSNFITELETPEVTEYLAKFVGLEPMATTDSLLTQVETGNESIVAALNFQNTIIAIDEKQNEDDPEDKFSFESYVNDAILNSEVLTSSDVSVEGLGFKETVSNIWRAIVLAFKKMIAAIVNFVKAVQQKIREMGEADMEETYQKYQRKYKWLLLMKTKPTFNGIMPSIKLDFTKIIKQSAKHLYAINTAVSKFDKQITVAMESIEKMSVINASFFKKLKNKIAGTINSQNDQVKNATKLLAASIKSTTEKESKIFGKVIENNIFLGAKSPAGRLDLNKLPNAGKVVRLLIWGNEKPVVAKISARKFIKLAPIEILSSAFLNDVRMMLDATKNISKSANELSKMQEQRAKQAIQLAQENAEFVKGPQLREFQQSLNFVARHSNIVKMGVNYTTQVTFNIYREIFRARGFVKAAINTAEELKK